MDEALLLKAYQPAACWADRGCYYRQWRLVQGETHEPSQERRSVPRQLTTSSFQVTDLLGEGNYSQVMFAKLRSTQVCSISDRILSALLVSQQALRAPQEPIALKVIEKQKVKRYKKEDELRVEKWVLTNLRHPSIIQLFGTFQDQGALRPAQRYLPVQRYLLHRAATSLPPAPSAPLGCLYLALELCSGGELWAVAHKVGMRQSLAAFYTAQLVAVLEFLHSRGVVHRDVKPENVLLTETRHIKLIDFGTAKLLRDVSEMGERWARDGREMGREMGAR